MIQQHKTRVLFKVFFMKIVLLMRSCVKNVAGTDRSKTVI